MQFLDTADRIAIMMFFLFAILNKIIAILRIGIKYYQFINKNKSGKFD